MAECPGGLPCHLGIPPHRHHDANHWLRLSLRAGQPFAENVALDSVGTWYVRSLPLPLPFFPPVEGADEFHLDDLRRSYAAGCERRSFLSGFVAAMERRGARLVNPPSAMAQHFRKPEQLTAMADAGVPVPRTCGGPRTATSRCWSATRRRCSPPSSGAPGPAGFPRPWPRRW